MKHLQLKKLLPLFCLCLCAVFLSLPFAFSRWEERRLFASSHPRPAVEGMLDEKQQVIPLIADLFRRRYLGEAPTGDRLPVDDTLREELNRQLNSLGQAGLLSGDDRAALAELLTSADEDCLSVQMLRDFVRVEVLPGPEDPRRLSLELHSRTGKIVTFSASGLSPATASSGLLEAYRAYLEPPTITDWESCVFPSLDQSACWSAESQLYVYCSVKKDALRFGVLSQPREEVERFLSSGS